MSVLLKLSKRVDVGFVDVNSQLIKENYMNKCIYVTKVGSCHLLLNTQSQLQWNRSVQLW